MRVLRIASPPIFLSYAVRWRTSSPGGRVCIRFVHYLLILIVSSSSTNPLKTSKEKEKNFFLPVPHQDAIPLPRLNDGPDFSSRERACVITCPLVSLVVLRGLKSCVAGLGGIRISAIPFRRHKTRNVLGEKKTFFLTSPITPQDSDESSAFISVTRKFFCRFALGIFFWSSLFSSYARNPSESSPRAVSRVESARGIRHAQGGGKEAKNEAPGAP